MALKDEINRRVQDLPDQLQAEVLDFVEFLLQKANAGEEHRWSTMSLASAMRGMEEDEVDYSPADIKVPLE